MSDPHGGPQSEQPHGWPGQGHQLPHQPDQPGQPSQPGQQWPGQQWSGQQWPSQQWSGQPGQQWGPPLPPPHPDAASAQTLGVVGMVAGFFTCIGFFISPFAWHLSNRVLREIDASGGRWGGRSMAETGRITGIIGTVMIGVALLALIAVIALWIVGVLTFTWWWTEVLDDTQQNA